MTSVQPLGYGSERTCSREESGCRGATALELFLLPCRAVLVIGPKGRTQRLPIGVLLHALSHFKGKVLKQDVKHEIGFRSGSYLVKYIIVLEKPTQSFERRFEDEALERSCRFLCLWKSGGPRGITTRLSN